jgi:hypothetical protein
VFAIAGAISAAGQTESVLYAFQGGNDGYFPESYALILDKAGNLYGVTPFGGGGDCPTNVYPGCGVIFQLAPPAQPGGAWTENVIWRFAGGTDGGIPGGLFVQGGKLLGETLVGGDGNCLGGCGYIYELIPPTSLGGTWSKTLLYEFPAAAEECGITASDTAGNFYGVNGIASANGSVCKVAPPARTGGTWTVTTLYTFKGVAPDNSIGDGSSPLAVTFDTEGNLRGTTASGGFCQPFQGGSCFGTVFELSPPSQSGGAWQETAIFRFSPADGSPTSGVVIGKDGALYGITYIEGYELVGSVLTRISGTLPEPSGGLILDASGNAYGTTGGGGEFDDGTVYRLTPPEGGSTSWTQTILHNFAGGTDGWNPIAPLTLSPSGALYGTAMIGGNQGCQLGLRSVGCGVVFEVTP